jgi:RHS repeat-associated protein
MVDGVGTTTYGYDAAGQILSEDGPWPDDTVSYTYNNRLRASMSVPAPNASAWTENYTYDTAKRLSTLTSPAGSFGYTYDPARNLQVGQITLRNGAYITNTYDTVSRLLSTVLKNSGLSTINSHSYQLNAANQRTQQVFTAGNFVNYAYDNAGQLITAVGKESGGTTNRLNEQLGYAYDPAGNLNCRTNNALVQSFGVNDLNELTTVTRSGTLTVEGTTTSQATNVTVNSQTAALYGDSTFAATNFTLADGTNTFTAVAKDSYGRIDTNTSLSYLPSSISYTYDSNGNLTGDGSRCFAYDDENQLVSVWVTNAWRSDFSYDGRMRRRVRTEMSWNGSTWLTNQVVRYVYDGNLVIQERYFAPQLSTPIPQQTIAYTRGRDLSGTLQGAGGIGGLLARTDLSTLNPQLSTAYYHCDGNGNVTCLINPSQAIVARYLYDPYGNILSQSGPLADANLYRFSTKEFHVASGLVYYLYRFYDPSLQRWPNRDPAQEAGGENLYEFVENRPAMAVDPDGLGSVPLPDFPPFNGPGGGIMINGCIGLCLFYQNQGCPGKLPQRPEDASRTKCFATKADADAYTCPSSRTKFEFAKQGHWGAGKPPKPGRHGRVPVHSISDSGGDFNYVTCQDGLFYWMSGGAVTPGGQLTVPTVFWDDKPPKPGTSWGEIWCVTCKCK